VAHPQSATAQAHRHRPQLGSPSSEASPPWPPSQVAHADWGSASSKRVVATAELRDGAYVAHPPRGVEPTGGLLERMSLSADRRQPTLVGFDFPIGVPRAYAHRAGIADFAAWFRALDLDAPLFEVADDLEQVSTARPFFPKLIAEKSPGIKARFHTALGLADADVHRRCDRAHCGRRAASEIFWTLGPQAVGKATIAGWRDTLRPALAERHRRYALWPFDGPLPRLLAISDAVIVETYPAEAYRRLDLRMGRPGSAKTRQADRAADAGRLLRWAAAHGVIPDEELTVQILDGFGPRRAGEDPFDAVTGLFGMIDTLRCADEPQHPDDPAVTRIEGWMFGQHAACR
jgi:hypothetical protein